MSRVLLIVALLGLLLVVGALAAPATATPTITATMTAGPPATVSTAAIDTLAPPGGAAADNPAATYKLGRDNVTLAASVARFDNANEPTAAGTARVGKVEATARSTAFMALNANCAFDNVSSTAGSRLAATGFDLRDPKAAQNMTTGTTAATNTTCAVTTGIGYYSTCDEISRTCMDAAMTPTWRPRAELASFASRRSTWTATTGQYSLGDEQNRCTDLRALSTTEFALLCGHAAWTTTTCPAAIAAGKPTICATAGSRPTTGTGDTVATLPEQPTSNRLYLAKF